MTERVLPAPDRYATCPTDGFILDYYTGVFESVYVVLHPFIRPVSITLDLFKSTACIDRLAVVNSCEAIRWSDILALAGFSSIREIDVGLRTLIGALRSTVPNSEFAGRLAALSEFHEILPPQEGQFSDLLHNRILDFFQQVGYSWVWVGDEFCTKRRLYWIDDLKDKEADATLGPCNVFAPDYSLLWTTHWDSCCSFLCGPTKVLEQLAAHREFEGFFCTPQTHVYWGLHET